MAWKWPKLTSPFKGIRSLLRGDTGRSIMQGLYDVNFSKFATAVGGYLEVNSHADGGIDINVEGGEYIIPKYSVNPATLSTLEYIKIHGDVPMRNAKDRSK